MRIISESIPHFRSISLGLWIPSGSRYEDQSNNGITHLIEHLLFKGTKKRTYRDIAIAFDSLGAEFNAFTDKENSCVYADFIDTHLDKCLDLLFDVITNPSFLPENIKLEKKVIMEEIKMVKDNPSDDIFNYFYDVVFSGHPLSLSILGTKKSLSSLDYNAIKKYFEQSFSLNGIVLSSAGNIEHNMLVEMVKEKMEGIFSSEKIKPKQDLPLTEKLKGVRKVYKGKTEASHICYGGPGCKRSSADRYPLSLFTNILGGSISSRLFQKIREEKGLSYTIFASNTQYTDAGIIAIYAATSSSAIGKVIELINAELMDIKKRGITAEELDIAKENTKGNIVLGVEDISSRMFRLGKALLMDGTVSTIDDILKKIDNVKIDSVNDIADKYFNPDRMSSIIIVKPQNGRAK
ncbi:MAG: Protease 3 precursor [Actinobacteria bacterium ADurb.Bin346]|nr:MAG: Protease 3 precursor [Actinobacteria bacterium ADurb.Bin346]